LQKRINSNARQKLPIGISSGAYTARAGVKRWGLILLRRFKMTRVIPPHLKDEVKKRTFSLSFSALTKTHLVSLSDP